MFYPFTNYKVIDVPQTNSESGAVVYTTTSKCIMMFEPDGTGMESDAPVWIFVQDLYTDTDGQEISPIIWGAYDSPIVSPSGVNGVSGRIVQNVDTSGGGIVGGMVSNVFITPAGKQVKAKVLDNSDRIKGKLHVFELPS